MENRFRHPDFRTYSFEQVPLSRDVFLIDERWLSDYEAARLDMFKGGDYRAVGYISYAAVRAIGSDWLELSWYPNVVDRFHEVSVRLPRSAFIECVDTPRWDEKPHIFVNGSWLSGLHVRPYSAFALVDAIGVKDALFRGQLSGTTLVRLRDRLDVIAADSPQVAFVSFADSVLLKMNWFVGQFDADVSYSYEPESLIRVLQPIVQAYREEVGLDVYAAITQGVNEYEDTALLHRSPRGNHVSLNSLGLPFAQLLAIDDAARRAIRSGEHLPAEVYLDEQFYHSLGFREGFDSDRLPRARYRAPLTSMLSNYVYTDRQTVLQNLAQPKGPRKK